MITFVYVNFVNNILFCKWLGEKFVVRIVLVGSQDQVHDTVVHPVID